jgi:hypothetical protein
MKLALDWKLVEVALAAAKFCKQHASDGKAERIRVAVLCAKVGDPRTISGGSITTPASLPRSGRGCVRGVHDLDSAARARDARSSSIWSELL